jgi:hypothetical protein
MKHRMMRYLILLAGFACNSFARQPAEAVAVTKPDAKQTVITTALQALSADNSQTVAGAASSVTNPAARLYFQAEAERRQGHPQAAIQLAARAVTLHYQDVEWLPRNELLCAQLYFELGLTNAAVATARQIENLYTGTEISKKAAALRSRIEGGTDGTPE